MPVASVWLVGGERVIARYLASSTAADRRSMSKKRRAGAGKRFAATVVACCPDGTYDLQYDCGIREEGVAPSSIDCDTATVETVETVETVQYVQYVEAAEFDERIEYVEAVEVTCEVDDDDDDDDDDEMVEVVEVEAEAVHDRDEDGDAALLHLAEVCGHARVIGVLGVLSDQETPPRARKSNKKDRPRPRPPCATQKRHQRLPSHRRTVCIEDGCSQCPRHASGRCRLCENEALLVGLPECVEEGCHRRLVVRLGVPASARCWTCAQLVRGAA